MVIRNILRRLGEYNKDLSKDEKYSNRLRMVRKKKNKRASKYSLDKETDLTHFGKKIGDMSKTELRQANTGSGDEADAPFSYDSLIAQSKERRTEARRQKMEAEAELVDLDESFKGMLGQLERRDIDRDKMENGKTSGEDDLAFLARSFQMDNIKKAMAGDRTITAAEKEDKHKQLVSQSIKSREAAGDHHYSEDEEDSSFGEEVLVESDNEIPASSEHQSPGLTGQLFGLIRKLIESPSSIQDNRTKLIELARSTPGAEVDEYFKEYLFCDSPKNLLVLLKIVTVLFPLDHLRHAIAVPALKLLEKESAKPVAGLSHLVLLYEFLAPGAKFSPSFLALAGRLFRSSDALRSSVLSLVSLYCQLFTREALYGPIKALFPELLPMISKSAEPFIPLRLHQFKPVEVLSLEPAYHEDGEQWNGQHKELRAQKKLERQVKQDKRLTAKEMRREAIATESFHAIQKAKEKARAEQDYKRTVSKMFQAEENYKQMRTDNGKDDGRRMKSNKKRRQ